MGVMKRPAAANAKKDPKAQKKDGDLVDWSTWTQEDEQSDDASHVPASIDGEPASSSEDEAPVPAAQTPPKEDDVKDLVKEEPDNNEQIRKRGAIEHVKAGEDANGAPLPPNDSSKYTPGQKYPLQSVSKYFPQTPY